MIKADYNVLLSEVRELSSGKIHCAITKASENPRLAPGNFEQMLTVAAERPIRSLADWFVDRLTAIVECRDECWGDIFLYKIVEAATSVIPGRHDEYRNLWLELLKHQRFATLAYGALPRTEAECLEFLPKWWEANPENKESLVRVILVELFRKREEREVFLQSRERMHLRTLLEQHSADWPSTLAVEVASFLHHGRHD